MNEVIGIRDSIKKRSQITVVITNELIEQIQSMAEQEGRTRSNMGEFLLGEKLREMEKTERQCPRAPRKV